MLISFGCVVDSRPTVKEIEGETGFLLPASGKLIFFERDSSDKDSGFYAVIAAPGFSGDKCQSPPERLFLKEKFYELKRFSLDCVQVFENLGRYGELVVVNERIYIRYFWS